MKNENDKNENEKKEEEKEKKEEKKNPITQRIINTRRNKGYSAESIASKLSISDSSYKKREAEITQWKIEEVQMLAEILSVSESYLFCDIPDLKNNKENENILNLINKLTPRKKALILEIIQCFIQK